MNIYLPFISISRNAHPIINKIKIKGPPPSSSVGDSFEGGELHLGGCPACHHIICPKNEVDEGAWFKSDGTHIPPHCAPGTSPRLSINAGSGGGGGGVVTGVGGAAAAAGAQGGGSESATAGSHGEHEVSYADAADVKQWLEMVEPGFSRYMQAFEVMGLDLEILQEVETMDDLWETWEEDMGEEGVDKGSAGKIKKAILTMQGGV